MADRWTQLSALAVGDLAGLPVQVTAKSASGITLAPVSRDPTTGAAVQNGSLVVASAGTVSGPGWSTDPKVQPMLTIARQLAIGDVLLGLDGMAVVVRAVGLGADGTWWSAFVDGRGAQPQDGLVVVGHVTLP
jgi:hypothetical protein